jgi:hypothetical protein
MEECPRQISWDSASVCFQWFCLDLIFVHLISCDYMLDSSDLCFSSSATVAVLVQWSFGALERRLSHYLQQGFTVFVRERQRRQHAIGINVISVTSHVLCTSMMFDE